MLDCRAIDALATPYVDGAIDPADRAAIDQHLKRCSPCRQRLSAEQAVHQLLRERHAALTSSCAPAALRTACARTAVQGAANAGRPGAVRPWPIRFAPFAAAAALVLAIGGAFLYQATGRSARLLAAELAADHVKCLALNAVFGTHDTAAAVEGEMLNHFGWAMHLPGDAGQQELELVGSRQCLYGHGRIAHIMYRRHGELVSLYMLPRTERPAQTLDVFGHECAIWSKNDRTFVLVSREARADVEQLATFMHAALE